LITKEAHTDMNWIDLPSLKLLAASIWLTIFSLIIPENLVALMAVGASMTTIAFNLYRFIQSRKQPPKE
jgi:hypothetical protein